MLSIINGYHLQLRHLPLLFSYFKQFNFKTATVHHPVLRKEVNELLTMSGIEKSTYGAGFWSNVFVVPICINGL